MNPRTQIGPRVASCFVAGAIGISASPACGQSSSPAIFVANNGNLEGSISSLLVAPDGSLTFKQKIVTGSVPNSQQFHPGLNAYSISISPDGRFVAVGHATASQTVEQITILEVFEDASIAIRKTFTTPDSPLDVEWIRDGLLAVTRTSFGGVNNVLVYAFDPSGPAGGTVTLVDSEVTGAFSSWIAVHPSRERISVQDSTGTQISTFAVAANGELEFLQSIDTGSTYPLGLGISPDGTWLYSGGGISSGGNAMQGWSIGDDGTLAPLDSSPFVSPGSSPKQLVVAGSGAFAYAAHGTDATIRGFALDGITGALTDIGVSFDVGFQGSLGEIIAKGTLLFATDRDTLFDGVRGVYSFTVGEDGSLTQNGPLVDTQGIAPNSIAVWMPRSSLFADINGDGIVDGEDLGLLLSGWGSDAENLDLDANGVVDGGDLGMLLAKWS